MQPQKRIPANGANGPRMTGENRRLQILRVAMRLFSQRGFRGTTTKEIALAAGVSEAMVFRHFATKEELYSAILDHKACVHETMDPLQVVADAVAAKDDSAVFEGLALDALNQHDCDPEFHRLLLHSALEEHELAQMFWEKFVKRVYRTLRGYIRERQREGAMKQVDPLVVVATAARTSAIRRSATPEPFGPSAWLRRSVTASPPVPTPRPGGRRPR